MSPTAAALRDAATRGFGELFASNRQFRLLMLRLASVGRVGIAGGALRSWYFGREPRDVDLVVECESPAKLRAAVASWCVCSTSLGGNRLHVGGVIVDVWALQDTARHEGCVVRSFEQMVSTMFLSSDAGVLVLPEGELVDCGMVNTIDSGVLYIVTPETSQHAKKAAKALRLAKDYGWVLDAPLAEFVLTHGEMV